MAEFVEVRNTGNSPALVGDKYIYPLKVRRVLLGHYEAAKAKGLSLAIVGVAPTAEPMDDFTVLTGVGKKRQGDLYQAGVTTYEKLLAADTATLAETLAVTAEQVKAWQEEAYGRTYP